MLKTAKTPHERQELIRQAQKERQLRPSTINRLRPTRPLDDKHSNLPSPNLEDQYFNPSPLKNDMDNTQDQKMIYPRLLVEENSTTPTDNPQNQEIIYPQSDESSDVKSPLAQLSVLNNSTQIHQLTTSNMPH